VAGFRAEYPGVVPESKLEIQMLHDRLLVKSVPDRTERRSSAGLVIPDTVKLATRLAWGEVVGAGTSARHVKTGDRVLFDPEEQGEVELNGERYVILRERDVHAVANEAPERGTGLYL
jgi:chaperonin GroES